MGKAMEESRKNRRKEIEKKVVDLFSSATPKIPRRKKAADTTVSVRGNRNIVAGDNNIINNFSAPPVITRTVIVKTGDGVLTAEQKGAINKTIEDWAGKRNAVRRSRVEIAALRKAFNRYMSVNSYHEIHQEHFEKAMKWLRRQIGTHTTECQAPEEVVRHGERTGTGRYTPEPESILMVNYDFGAMRRNVLVAVR